MRRLFILTLCAAFSSCLSAQASEDVPTPAPAAPSVSDSATKPSMLWGTVIARDQFKPLTGEQRWGLYWRQTYWTPGPYFAAFGIAAADQRNNQPYEWGQGFDAYMKRAGNQFARSAIQDSIEAAGAAALKQDVRYVKCRCTGVFKRTAYAIGVNFVTLNEKGNFVPAYARYAGAIAAPYIANTWMPAGYRNWNTSLRDGGLQLAFNSAFNVIREFIPMKKKP